MLKSNSEGFKKEASAASEKSRSLQVALSKMQVTLDSVSQVNQCDHGFLYQGNNSDFTNMRHLM